MLCNPKAAAQTKYPHLSVVQLFKELRCLNSEGRILHTPRTESSCFTERFQQNRNLTEQPNSPQNHARSTSDSILQTRKKHGVHLYRKQNPLQETCSGFVVVSLTMTYFRMGNPHYHRRGFVSRSCSGWEGVVPKRYGRQTLTCVLCRFLSATTKLEGKSW